MSPISAHLILLCSAGGEVLPEGVHAGDEYRGIVETLAGVVQNYLTEARGDPADDFTADTPFMDAGLDSLDMLKVYSRLYAVEQPQSQAKSKIMNTCNRII